MTTTHRISTGIVLALALGIGAAPVSAKQIDLTPNGSEVPAGSPSVRSQATTPSHLVTPPATIVRVTTPDSGFDWGDAGIGAAGGIALSVIGLGGALAVSQHRTRHTPTPQP